MPKRQEESAAKQLGGRRHPGSGSVWVYKGDASGRRIKEWVFGGFMVESKGTERASRSVGVKEFLKAQNDAWSQGMIPVMDILFERIGPTVRLAVLEWDVFTDLVEAAVGDDEDNTAR